MTILNLVFAFVIAHAKMTTILFFFKLAKIMKKNLSVNYAYEPLLSPVSLNKISFE